MFSVKADLLRGSINSLRKALGTLEILQIKSLNKSKLQLSGKSSIGAAAVTTLNADIANYCRFAVETDLLSKLCVGRGNIKFESQGNSVDFRGSGRYQGNFATMPLEDITVIDQSISKQDTSYFKYLATNYLPKLGISNIKDSNVDLGVMFKGDGEILKLAVTDMLHLAIITSKDKLKVNHTLPMSYLPIMTNFFKEEGGGYNLSGTKFYCWNSNTDLALPLKSNLLESWEVVTLMEGLSSPLTIIELDIGELRKICHNLTAMYQGSNLLSLTFLKEGLGLSCSSANGSVKDVLPVKYIKCVPLTFYLNMSLLLDIIDGPLTTGVARLLLYRHNTSQVIKIQANPIDNHSRLSYYLLASVEAMGG